MRAVDLIVRKRDGGQLAPEEIDFLVRGFTSGEIPDYQFASLLMAIVLKGMTPEETARLTRAMIESGEVLDLAGVPGPLVDKHSTGGVGDKVSLVLAPLAAACGLRVPMMSGRSLGHTGGTLDKLESIPGYRTDLSPKRFREALEKVGFAMIGQSESVVPADRRMYALRDVTGTVESIPLITASIMSKKFAEGAQALLMDVKTGSGAFMKDRDRARALAQSLVSTGAGLGRRVAAMITDMDRPLGRAVGNFLEVRECIDCMNGAGPAEEVDLIVQQASRMLWLGGLAGTPSEGEKLARQRLQDGSAWKVFLANVEFQGGSTDVLLHPEKGPTASVKKAVVSPADGFVGGIDAYATGIASVLIGVGRSRKEDRVLPSAGILVSRAVGEAVRRGDELCVVHGESASAVDEACRLLAGAWRITTGPVSPGPRLLEEITRA
ncbi:MAG TPA: thymidine phosphorylase [Spirochaetia bacterium]|nr:thymidine phosphorylase [Spirochaetia bacterium]